MTVELLVLPIGPLRTNVSLIGDDFGTLQVSLTFQKDETIVTAGKSQYFELQQAA